jgi:hypothetical protein
MNAEGATLTLGEMQQFTTTAVKYGVPTDTEICVKVVEGVAVFSLPVTLVHRTLAATDTRRRAQVMRTARRQRR